MNDKIRKVLTFLLALVFVSSSAKVLLQRYHSRQAQAVNAMAVQTARREPSIDAQFPTLSPAFAELQDPLAVPLASAPTAETAPQREVDAQASDLLELDLDALKQVNPDVLGWIYIPDTVVDYPLMVADSSDEYLNKAWDGTENPNGSVYLEHQNDASLLDFNSIIYAHNNSDGTMFGSLWGFSDQEYATQHPYIYIRTEGEIRRYAVFASYMATVDSTTYWLNFSGTDARQAAIDAYLQQSFWDNGVTPTGSQRIVTLSTCSGTGNYTYRWVVQGVLEEVWSVE